jgi:Fe-S cluster biogenesis protein NfuA
LEDSVCHIGVEFTKETIRDRVAKALEELKPKLQADGGDIELLGLENGVVKVRMKGACAGCPMSAMTLKMGVEQYLKKSIPEIVRVDAL